MHAIKYQIHSFCDTCTNLVVVDCFGGKRVREEGVFHNVWETLWKVRQIKAFLRVFHRENLFFLWKTFWFPLEIFCGICHGGEKTEKAENILTA